MGKEFRSEQFYIHKSYIPVYYFVYMRLEQWIAENIFRGDLSRVFAASNDYAFRRRFELTDQSEEYDKIEASSLCLPFANYNIFNAFWKPDTRIAANTAAMVYKGIEVGQTKIRASASILTLPVTFYFGREDDARLAFEKLYFQTFNEHYYDIEVPYGTDTLGLPFNITIKNLMFNPEFNEKSWLQKNKVWTIKVDFDIRSYIIVSPEQPNYQYRVDSQGYIVNDLGVRVTDSEGGLQKYDDGIAHYQLVEQVVLNFMSSMGQKIETYANANELPEVGDPETVYVLAFDDGTVQYRKWAYGGYIQYQPEDLNTAVARESVLEPKVRVDIRVKTLKGTNATIKWAITSNVEDDEVVSISLKRAGSKEAVELPKTLEGTYKITGLKPGSTYDYVIEVIMKSGAVNKFNLNFTTPSSADKVEPRNSVIAMSW